MIASKAGLVMKYFVLNPGKMDVYGEASRNAVLTYADCIHHENEDLARDLRNRIASLNPDNELGRK